FDARGRIEGGRFRFQEAWPALESTQADVAFVGHGFQVRASPLHDTQGETLDNLQASGPARATFMLNLPLKDGQPGRLSGTVDLAGTRLVERRWDLAFDAVRGQIRYDGNGFSAGDLAVSWEGQPGRLSLRAGHGHVQDPAQAFEAGLTAPMDASRLLARAPELDWMRPYVHGRSEWTLGLAVPAAAPAGSPSAQIGRAHVW